jgi:hypothetical protein
MRLHHLRSSLVLSLLLAGCAPATVVPTDPPDIAGTITGVLAPATADGPTRVRIEANPAEESGSPKMVLAVERGTRILERTSATETRPVGIDALRVGERVRAWVSGPIMESYPSQGSAGTIVLDRGPAGS